MSTLERLGLKVLHKMDPEAAHGWALTALRLGLGGSRAPVTSERLKTSLCGLDLPNPIGISAGFDKNAYAIHAALRTGIGFAEIGAATPRAQYGNLKPRLFRLSEDRAVINRFGFNNDGAYAIHRNLTRAPRNGIVGINLGANKTSDDKAADYVDVLTRFHGEVDFATVNVSSPNTEKLRDLQGRAALDALLTRVVEARDALGALPVFLKIAPDLTEAEITDIAEVCLERGIDGIVATNTTLSREGLHSPLKAEAGGMSGPPLFEKSTDVLRQLYRATGAKIPLVGVGGVSTAEHAYAKIRAGASAVQLYTGFVYGGVSLGAEIAEGLDALLARDGTTVADAVGTDA